MSSSYLTPTVITRESLRVFHQKLNFIGKIDRQYDDRFAKSGAKIGSTLQIREPNQFTVRTGTTMNVQDVTETKQDLTIATRKGVDMNFDVNDLTLTIDDFSKRYIDPAMSVLAANVEADAMSMYKDVWNSTWGSAATYNDIVQGARVKLQRGLTPTNARCANLNPADMADIVVDTKSLFQDQKQLSDQYLEGYMGRAAGFDFVENTLWPNHTTGGEDGNYVVNTSTGITSGSATIAVTGGTGTLAPGDTITIGSVYSVHPETKTSTGVLQEFVITTAYAGGAGDITVSPTPVTSGATQNVTISSAGSGKAVTVNGTASTAYTTSLAFHKEAFTFVTADLVMPKGVEFAAREVLDGISMRIVQDYDIVNDTMPLRIDILYGYKTLRPQYATRLHYTA